MSVHNAKQRIYDTEGCHIRLRAIRHTLRARSGLQAPTTSTKEKAVKQKFLAAIHSKNKTRLSFYSKDDTTVIERICAPMDFGPNIRYKDNLDRYHVFDFESDTKPHPLFLLPSAVINLAVLDNHFDPADFVSWDLIKYPWIIKRDWGRLS